MRWMRMIAAAGIGLVLAGGVMGQSGRTGTTMSRSQATESSPATRPGSAPAIASSEELEHIRLAVERLQETPTGKRWQELTQQMSELAAETNERRKPLDEALRELRVSEEGREYQKRLDELARQREAAMKDVRAAIYERAKEIYSARQEELRGRALPEVPNGRALGFDVLTYPKIDGSTSTHPLAVLIACRLLECEYEWVHYPPRGSFGLWMGTLGQEGGRALSMARPERARFDSDFSLATIRLQAKTSQEDEGRLARIINGLLAAHSNTHQAYVNLIERKVDLSLVARAPSPNELKLAKDQGVEIEVVPIALDALVFIVNEKNPVRNLSRDAIRDIYLEKSGSWKDLGGPDKPIRPLRRERDSGSQELLEELVLGAALPDDPSRQSSVINALSMAGPFNRVTQDEQAVAFSLYYYEHFMAGSPQTPVVSVDGVEPTAETIRSGQYPLVTKVYVAFRKDEPRESAAMRYLAWLTSAEGQAVVRESGYVPVAGR